MIKAMYEDALMKVRMNGSGKSRAFIVKVGVHYSSVLSSLVH